MDPDKKRASTKLTAKLCLLLMFFQLLLFAAPDASALGTAIGAIARKRPKQETPGFQFRYTLSEGKCPFDTTDVAPLVPAQTLPESETQALLRRLPPEQQPNAFVEPIPSRSSSSASCCCAPRGNDISAAH